MSDIHVTGKGLQTIPPDLLAEIWRWYEAVGCKWQDEDAALYIESKWGDRLLVEVCLPWDMEDGECLVIVLDLLKARCKEDGRPWNRPSDPPAWRKSPPPPPPH